MLFLALAHPPTCIFLPWRLGAFGVHPVSGLGRVPSLIASCTKQSWGKTWHDLCVRVMCVQVASEEKYGCGAVSFNFGCRPRYNFIRSGLVLFGYLRVLLVVLDRSYQSPSGVGAGVWRAR